MTAPRVAVEREILARLLTARDPSQLRRWVDGLRFFGLTAAFTGENRWAFLAISTLVSRGKPIDVDAVVHESQGRVDGNSVAWIAAAYAGGEPLLVLAERLRDAHRRAAADSIAHVLVNAARDPAGDVERAIAVAVAALRRVRRAAA